MQASDQVRPKAIIAGAHRTGVLGARSLFRRGVSTYFIDSDKSEAGFSSAYGLARACPDPDLHSDAWLKFMLALSHELGDSPVLIASSDKFVCAIARHADVLGSHFRISPTARLHGELSDKLPQYTLAEKHGMPMPKTAIVNSISDLEKFAQQAAYPCLIKPMHFREWHHFPDGHPLLGKKIAIAESAKELLQSYELAAPATPSVVAQEIIQGTDKDKRVYLACYDSTGHRIGNAMFRELRCDPMGFGPASVTEPVVDPEADAICDSFLRKIGYSGICEIEVKRDLRDGKIKLIEANPRLSGGGDAAPYAGVDLCWIHYQDLAGITVEPVSPKPGKFRHIVLRADAKAIPNYLAAGQITWKEVLATYRPPLAFYDWDRKDWRYSLVTLYRVMKGFIGTSLRCLLHRGGPT